MAELDHLELGKTLGRVEQKVDALIISFSDYKTKVDKDIAEHDAHIVTLIAEKNVNKGKAIAYGSLSGFGVYIAGKAIEHFPALVKSIIG